MYQLIQKVEAKYRKPAVVDVRSGDTVRVSQKVKEGNKERIQMFEGVVIRTDRKNSLTSSITVRRIASGVGVEKTYLLHSPLVIKVEIVRRSKVRRKFLSYLRDRSGKSARLTSVAFDREAVNALPGEKTVPVQNAAASQEVAEAAGDSIDQSQETVPGTEASAEAVLAAETPNQEDQGKQD